jgi:HSP20 family protein
VSNLTEQVRQGAGQALASLSQGWREIKHHANGALTHFRSSGEKGADGSGDIELPALSSWGFMAADVVDGKDSVVVRLEAPGMSRSDFNIEVVDDTLRVQGEKRIEREFQGDGYRTIQSAYGSFRRDVPLPGAVNVDQAKATYRDGVLRIVLPKVEGAKPRRFSVQVT